MTKSEGKKRLSPYRRREQVAHDRRVCITWVGKLVNKQVEKRIGELRSEFILMKQTLKEEMAAELQKQLKELVVEEARRYLHDTALYPKQHMASHCREEYNDTDEESDENSVDLKTCSFNISETPNSCTERKPPICKMDESLNSLLDADCSDAHFSSQPTKCKQKKKHVTFSSNLTTVCEEESCYAVGAKGEEHKLFERQWREWMDNQEMRGIWRKLVNQEKIPKQEAEEPSVSEKQMKQNMKEADTVKKIKTYVSNFFSLQGSSKWERFENED